MTVLSPSPSLVAVLARYPDFRLLWTGNLVSSAGIWMQNLAQGWLVLELSDSPLVLGVAGFASLVPTLALSLVAGTIADRVDRRRILFGAQIALMLLALLLGASTSLGLVTPSHIVAIVFLSGVATAVSSPAYQAAIADLVPGPDLTRAIALNSVQFNVARIVGHAAAGGLVVALGAAGCFYINGATYLVMLYALWRIRLSSGHIAQDATPFADRLFEGIGYVRTRKIPQYLISTVAIMSFLGLPYFFLLPAFARDVLEQGPRGLGYLMASVSVGALGGGLLMPRITDWIGKGPTVLGACLVFWAALLGFSLSRSYWLSVSLLVLLGLALVLTVATVNNLLQALTPAQMRGRVMSIYGMALNGLAPVGTLAAGALAEGSSAPVAVGSMAAAGLVLATIVVLKLVGQRDAALQRA